MSSGYPWPAGQLQVRRQSDLAYEVLDGGQVLGIVVSAVPGAAEAIAYAAADYARVRERAESPGSAAARDLTGTADHRLAHRFDAPAPLSDPDLGGEAGGA